MGFEKILHWLIEGIGLFTEAGVPGEAGAIGISQSRP